MGLSVRLHTGDYKEQLDLGCNLQEEKNKKTPKGMR